MTAMKSAGKEAMTSGSPPLVGSTNKTTFVHPTTEIIHEEEEEGDEESYLSEGQAETR